MKILFLYLTAFSTNGGIEKFNKSFMKCLSEENSISFKAISSHDPTCDERYIKEPAFKGFSGSKVAFGIEAVSAASNYDKIILGHINLAPVGLMIKKLYPQKHLTLIAHGIEVWGKLTSIKKSFLSIVDEVITVSEFTKAKLISNHKINLKKVKVLSNTIDPFFKSSSFSRPDYLLKRYNLSPDEQVLLTICRLSSEEKYKGYDKVIESLPNIITQLPELKYLIVGKYDTQEGWRVKDLIKKLNLQNNVILTDFIPDDELHDHYSLADLFVMPSKGEGFGIVYLEAMHCGIPVITGNCDGSKEIIDKIKIGKSVDPDNTHELSDAIIQMLNQKFNKQKINSSVNYLYNYESFKNKVMNLIVNKEQEPVAL